MRESEPSQQPPPAQEIAVPGQKNREGHPDRLQLLAAAFGALAAGGLYFALPQQLTVGPSWLLLVLVAVMALAPLSAAVILRRKLPYRLARGLVVGELVVLTAALVGALVLLVNNLELFHRGLPLLRTAVLLWMMNTLTFAVWYWEVDGGGPVNRFHAGHEAADFQFPQQVGGNTSGWAPGFVDYLFLAFCGATALSPADTLPLSRRAKGLMMLEALASVIIVVLLVARAVNIG